MRILITEEQYRLIEGHYVDLPTVEGVRLELYEKENKLQLDAIIVPKGMRKQGLGSKIMKQVIEYSENVNKPIFLSPDTSFGGSSFDRLVKFYKRFGFVKNTDKHLDSHYMVRYPSPKESEIDEIGSSEAIMSIKDLSEMVGRMGFDHLGIETIFEILLDAYRRSGDDGVIDMFKEMTDIYIEPISRGKYIFVYK